MSRLGWLSLSAPYKHWRMLAGVHGLAGSTPALSSILVAGATQACGECLGNCLSPQAQRREEMSDTHNVINCEHGVPIRAWTRGVTIEPEAQTQLLNVAQLPFVFRWIAAMPDVHWGIGATVGSVIPTKGAIIPAAVGVDFGCGMMAVQTTLNALQGLPHFCISRRDVVPGTSIARWMFLKNETVRRL